MARLRGDGTLDDNWMYPYQPGDPNLDPSLDSLGQMFPNDKSGGTPASTGPVDYSGTSGMPPTGGFTWPTDGQPPPVVHQGDTAADVPGLPMGTKPSDASNPASSFDNYLSRHPNDPQAAIDEWTKAGDVGGLAPKWYPDTKTIGLANGTYLVMPGTGDNKTAGWQVVKRGPEGAGSSTPAGGSQVNDVLSGLLTKLFGAGAADPNAALRKQLSDKFGSLMDQYSQPVNPDDPTIRATTDAYHGIEARNLSNYGEMAAERAHAEGVPVGAFDSAIGNATSAAGRDEAANLGTRMTNETNARRAALGGVLGQASNFSNVSDDQKLREELAVLSDATGNQQFYDSMAAGMGGQNNELDKLILTLLGK